MITITSRTYKDQLRELFYADISHLAHSARDECGEFCVVIPRAHLDVSGLAELFLDILLCQDELLSSCPRLYEKVRGMVFSNALVHGIQEFVKTSDTLSVDGYTAFRLQHYPHKILSAQYLIAKRIIESEFSGLESYR